MKRLGILWDPENPMVPVAPVVAALRAKVEVVELTFDRVGHRTLPNRAYDLNENERSLDGLLWIEGGPLPGSLPDYACPKASWVVNAHLEPTLHPEVSDSFDVRFCSLLGACSDESARWLPLSARAGEQVPLPEGISILVGDPKPASHLAIERHLRERLRGVRPPASPVVVALGEGGQVHPLYFDCLRAGAVVLSDPEADLRGLVHVGEHAERLTDEVRGLVEDPERLERIARRGPDIVRHLHEPELRAAQLVEAIWPRARIFGATSARPRVSVLVTCHRYLRRLKVCLESLARQSLPPGSLEIVVADPESPDGLAAYLPEFAKCHPELRVVHLPLDGRYHRNRGVGINRAFDVSSGEVVVSIDGDIVFAPHTLALLESEISRSPKQVLGVQRVFIDHIETERILAGEVDPFQNFGRLSSSPGDGEENSLVGVLGYCQAVHRAAFARARYPEEYDQVNQSDIVFVERLARFAGVLPRFLEHERVLHLWHPRNWMGTSDLL